MFTLIAHLIVLGLVYWLISKIPLPAPIPEMIRVLFIIIAVVYVLNAFGFNLGLPSLK